MFPNESECTPEMTRSAYGSKRILVDRFPWPCDGLGHKKSVIFLTRPIPSISYAHT